MADISMDLYLAYEDGYKKGKAEAEAYLLHSGDVTPVTNAARIRAMTDEGIEDWYWWMHKEMMKYTDARAFVHDWLKQEIDNV